MNAPAVIFDLDGTLVDPAGSITGGIASALEAHGLPRPAQHQLDSFVGPPLAASLAGLNGVSEEMVPSLIEHYRTEYLNHGMAASQVYPGISSMLTALGAMGVQCAVATSKPEPMAKRLLEIHGLSKYFCAVHGSDPDETVPHYGKGPIIAAALESVGLADLAEEERRRRSVMVGDRIFDVDGAHQMDLECWGVAWGFAPEGELESAGASKILITAEELVEQVQQRWDLVLSTP